MDTVTVVTRKPFIKTLLDKTVLQVENRLSISAQNAFDLLRSAPGVVIDPNDNIQMGGKSGVLVFIDGRNSQLNGSDLAQILKSIQADQIKEIELIRNPSAKYEAAGNAGIINIKLKKSSVEGMTGSFGASWAQSIHARENASLSLNLKKGNWNFYNNMSIEDGLQITIAKNERTAQTKNYIQDGRERDEFSGASIRLGLDHQINTKNSIGLMWMFNSHYTGMDNQNHTWINDPKGSDTNVFSRSIAPFKNDRNNLNLNYQLKIDSITSLSVDADRTIFHSGLNNLIGNEWQDQGLNKFAFNANQNISAVKIEIRSLKADLSGKLGKDGSWTTGIKSVHTITGNTLDVSALKGINWIADTSKTNRYHFEEKIQAAYLSLEKVMGKWQFQVGLRGEWSHQKGLSMDLKQNQLSKPDTSYLNFFPSIFVQYAAGKNGKIGGVYNRRIDRPTYQDQNPFIYQLDAFNNEQGNPYLLPQMTQNFELSYTYQDAHTIKLHFSNTKNYQEFITYQEGNKTINIPQNIGNRQMWNIEMSSSFKPLKWWSVYTSAEPFYQQYQTNLNGFGYLDQLNSSSWGFNGYISNTFSLPLGWKAELTGWYNYQNTTSIYHSLPFSSINLGFSKKIMNDKGSLKFSMNDLFNTQRWEQTAFMTDFQLHTYRKWESRNISFSFTYRFGNNKIKPNDERSAGNKDEMNRIK